MANTECPIATPLRSSSISASLGAYHMNPNIA